MSECLFCAAVAGSVSVNAVLSSATSFAFLDHRPVFKGHVLVVPRAHVPVLADLPETDVGPFFRDVQRLAAAVEVGLDAAGTFVAINNRVSQSVPHMHAHVVPRTKGDGLRGFFWPRSRYSSPEEMERVRAAIVQEMEGG